MIPENLDQCFDELDKMLSTADKDRLASCGDEKIMIRLHRTLGRRIRNEWGLWQNSKLKQFFKDIGINHPDDMSSIILTSYYRYIHNEPLYIDKQIKFYQDYWEKMKVEVSKI